MKGKLFQLKDSEEFDWGIVWCTNEKFPDEKFTKEYQDYYNNSDEPGIDEFVEILNTKYIEDFERVYVEEINL